MVCLSRFVITKLPRFVITPTQICNTTKLPQFVINSCSNLWWKILSYNATPNCNNLFYYIQSSMDYTTTELGRTITQYVLMLLCLWWLNQSTLGHVTKYYGFIYFIESYNSKIRNIVLGSWLFRNKIQIVGWSIRFK